MIQIDDVVVSLDVLREKFICILYACKGECCSVVNVKSTCAAHFVIFPSADKRLAHSLSVGRLIDD